MVEYYVLSLSRSRPANALWWGLDQRGYYSDLRYAYKCSQAEIEAEPERLNNGVTTMAIPCAEVDKVAQLTVPADVVDALVKRAAKRVA
jgi:hypothetical protein